VDRKRTCAAHKLRPARQGGRLVRHSLAYTRINRQRPCWTLDIHFIHVRSKHENALPLIVTHGWPGSIIEQMKIIDPLTNPTAHDRTAAEAFHLVIPSLPGYGFSEKPAAPGWNPVSIAKAWATLMQRLGYTKYVAQGGDWGNAISEVMALQQPPGLLGIHTNMAATVPLPQRRRLDHGKLQSRSNVTEYIS